jgi:hypothetical protein
MSEGTTPTSNGAPKPTAARQAAPPAITIEQLAAKVYQLMLEDARLARARGDGSRTRK